MQIIWYGHSCFLIKTSAGKRILIDPFNDSLGYNTDFPKCDLITMSHYHFDHSFLNKTNYDTKIINTAEDFDFGFVKIHGISTYHDEYQGLKRGPNNIFIFSLDNIHICHLGDLGHIPNSTVISRLDNMDILFVPIGGNFTLDGKCASKLCNMLNPKIIIPMHYKTNKINVPLDGSKDFILNVKNVEKINSNILDIEDINYNNHSKIYLLKSP